jgi:hypothetical protein
MIICPRLLQKRVAFGITFKRTRDQTENTYIIYNSLVLVHRFENSLVFMILTTNARFMLIGLPKMSARLLSGERGILFIIL